LLLEGNKVKTKQKKRERERPFLGGVEYFFSSFLLLVGRLTLTRCSLSAFYRLISKECIILLGCSCWLLTVGMFGGVCVDIYISLHRPYRENSERRPETDGMGLKGGIEREGERRITQSLMKSQESRARNVQQTRQFVSCENRADGREFCRLSLNHIFCPFCPGFTLLEPSQLVKSCFFLFSHSFHRWIK
jgi:hypothetical protein